MLIPIPQLHEQIQETATWIKQHTRLRPASAIILGSGLGHLADEIEVLDAFPYEDIPNFPVSTVEGHKGRLIFGRLSGCPIMALEGRFHYYEGYTMQQVTFPERVMYEIGIKNLFVSNAAGGLNTSYAIGDIMLITDHINFFPEHPLHGPNFPTGPRFPDMHQVYDRELQAIAREIAAEKGIHLMEGVYVGVQGPTYETPSEYKMYRLLGGDAIGMSTVPEVIVAHHCGIRCFGISIITDLGVEGKIVEVSHEEVQKAANEVQPMMATIFRELLIRITPQ